MNWKYVRKLEKSDLIDEFETKFKCKLPITFVECIKANNAGRPEFNEFNTALTLERTIKKMLSFNKNDIENIWDANILLNEINPTLIAFANDSFGNYICFDGKNGVVFFEHETESTESVSTDFSSFLSKLK